MERVIGLIAGRDRTLRLHPQADRRKHLHEINVNTLRTLGTGNLREAVSLPDGEDECEWYAAAQFCARLPRMRNSAQFSDGAQSSQTLPLPGSR